MDTWLLTEQQAAERMQLSPETVRQLRYRKKIPPDVVRKLGRRIRYHPALLQEWIDDGCPDARDRRRRA